MTDLRVYECSICGCEFDMDAEGGIAGNLGMIPANFCPTCFAGVFALVQEICARCQEAVEEGADIDEEIYIGPDSRRTH